MKEFFESVDLTVIDLVENDIITDSGNSGSGNGEFNGEQEDNF